MNTNSDAQYKEADVIDLSKFTDGTVPRKSQSLSCKNSSKNNAIKHHHMSKDNLNGTDFSSFRNNILTKNAIASKGVRVIEDKVLNTSCELKKKVNTPMEKPLKNTSTH